MRDLIKKILQKSDDLDWIRDTVKQRSKPYELMGELRKIFPEIEMEMVEDVTTTGGYKIEYDLEITSSKEINPNNEEWLNRASGIMIKFSKPPKDEKDFERFEKSPYTLGTWEEHYSDGEINDSDSSYFYTANLEEVIEYLKKELGPNGRPDVYYGQDEGWL